ncbi:MAG TPA: C39 family peptidase [Chloroflexota bacterium]|nr:C39 family peptidase [Chloroflexota bacterium]
MRRVAAVATALLMLATGCGRLAQEQDTLAPHVTTPQAPSAAAPSASEQPATTAPAPPTSCAGTACAVIASPAAPVASTAAAPASASAAASAPVSAAPTATASPSAPAVKVAPTAARVLLQPMQHEYETWNNCAPVTSEMVLSYYGISKRQTEIAPVLRPNPKNYSVRMDQIAGYLGQFGLESQPLIGGSLAQLKALVSNNIPVVVEDQLSIQEDYGHFRVVRGFDDAAGVLIFGDSYYGPTNRLSYGLYQELWKRHNDAFMPVFKPSEKPLVQAILGPDFDPATNLQHALSDAKQAVAAHPDDGFLWLDLGSDLYRANQLQDAQAAWEQARRRQLTQRTLWYTIWPAAVYNQVGEFQKALDVVAIPLATDPYNAEALLERGNAYKGLGNKERARADYALAADVDPSLVPAKQALQSLNAAS